nr:DNA helicase [Tanacetum cinerariifolium]
MIQVKEMMQDKDLKNSESKDEGSRSRSQSMNDQSHYKQAKTKTKINKDGYSKDLKMASPTGSSFKQKRITMLACYSYYLHDRANRYNYLSRNGRLFQQYVATAFCAIE